MPHFTIGPLGKHERSDFSCGVTALDDYFRRQASQDQRRRTTSCYVAVEQATGIVAGYYTIAMTGVPIGDLPIDVTKRLPRYPLVPAALIGRLAVDVRFQRLKLGRSLLADASLRVFRSEIKAFALIVDAKDATAAAFYAAFGFIPLPQRRNTLFLPLQTLEAAHASS